MKDGKQSRERLNGKRFFEGIKFWRKQILGVQDLKSRLRRSRAESKDFPKKLQEELEIRTAAESIVIKQLHQEIEHRKKAEKILQDALEFARGIVDTVREPMLVLGADLKVVSASRSFYQIFKVKPAETEHHHIYDLGNRQWNIPRLRELLENILPKTASFDDFEVSHDFPGIGKRIMLLNARKIYREANHTHHILLAIEDVTERRDLENKLKTLASHDELTGSPNFRSIMELLEKEIIRSSRYKKIFTLIMMDIDHFKMINDEHGHLAGNDALAGFASVIKKSIRDVDILGRYGGEEFMIIFPETDAEHAAVVLERIRNNLDHSRITSRFLKEEKIFKLKFSAGMAVFPQDAKELKTLIRAADDALRQAKQAGGNRSVLR